MKLVCFFLAFFIYLASSSASEKINEIGKIIYSKEMRCYYFIYLKDNNEIAAPRLAIKNKKEFAVIKNLLEKSIRLEGELDWKRGSAESFSLKEELNIVKLEMFELNVLAFDSHKLIQQDNFISHYKEPKRYRSNGGIAIPDTVANSLISGGAAAIGVLAGPISLIPAALFGIYEMIQ